MKAHLRAWLIAVGVLTVTVVVSACSGGGGETPTPTPTPVVGARPADIELGIASVAGKGEAELAVASGSLWDRFGISWGGIQIGPEDEDWNWEETDNHLNDEPMENVLVVLTGYPNRSLWNNYPDGPLPAPVDLDHQCVEDYHNDDRTDAYCVRFTGLDEDIYLENGQINPENKWAYFVFNVTSKYASKVNAWQIYNEVYWTVLDDDEDEFWVAPIHYLDAVEVAYQVIKSGPNGDDGTDPDAKLILQAPLESIVWEMAGYGSYFGESWKSQWYDQVLGLLKPGSERAYVASHIDAVALHLYHKPDRTFDYTRIVAERLPGKPIWFTESGWRNDPGERTSPVCDEATSCDNDNWVASYLLQQYAYTVKSFEYFGVPNGMIFHFSFRDLDEGDRGWIEGLVSEQEGNGTPRPSYFAFQFANRNLLNLDYDESGGDDGYTYMKFTRQSDNIRIFLVWNTTDVPIDNASIPVKDVQCIALFDQRGKQVDLVGNSTSDCISPSGGRLTMPLPGTRKTGILGGPTYTLIESPSSAPQGGAELACENGQLVGTRLLGYDQYTGLDEFRYRASPEKTYDLSWTQPGIVYGGVFKQVPPVGGTAILTLTNKAGVSIVQELFHPEDVCQDDNGGGSSAGGDHPDDNHSAASSPIPAGEFFALPEGARVPPRVAILNRGSSHGLWQMTLQLGETVDTVGSNFDPIVTAGQYPVLLIPSGALYGLENSPSFRARLEEYARLGGTVVAFAQQHGYEYSALPGGEVGGYGWDEDISCFDASLYISEWHPALSGFDRTTLDVYVDGYFSSWPEQTQVLLSRRVNGMPAVIRYPYGEGHVFATTIYDDWGVSQGQSSQDARTLLRDLSSWAITPDDLPQYAPGAVALDVPVSNTAAYTVTTVSLRLIDPARQVVLTRTVPITIPAGTTTTVPFTATTTDPLGIWRVDVSLPTFDGQAARFIVADPAEPVDLAPEISLNVTAPAYRFVANTGTTFTFIARNNSATTQTLELQYGLPHHTWQTRDPSYGLFYNNRVTLTIPAGGEAYHHWPRIISVSYDRLWARLVRDGEVVAQSHFGVFGNVQGAVSLSVSADSDTVQRTDTATLDISIANTSGAPLTTTLDVRVVDAAHTTYHTTTLTVPLAADPQSPETLVYSFTVPTSVSAGTGRVWIEAYDPDGRAIGGALASLSIPASSLAFAHLPFPLLVGESTVFPGLVVTNTSSILPVEGGVVTCTLSTPDGRVISATAPFTLDLSSSRTLTLPLALPPLTFGSYRLTTEVGDEYGTRQQKLSWWAYAPAGGTLDQPTYQAGDTAHLDLRLSGREPFVLPLTVTLAADLPYAYTTTLTLEPRATTTLTLDIPIPPDIVAGSYPLVFTMTLPSGDARGGTPATVQIPPSELAISTIPPAVNVGQTIYLTLTNTGGAGALASYAFELRDQTGWSVGSFQDDAVPVLAGGEITIPLAIPGQAAAGDYILSGNVTDESSGQETSLHADVHVTGLETTLASTTDQEIYLTGDSITVTAVLTNAGTPLVDASLTMRIVQEMPQETEWTVYDADDSGLAGNYVTAVAFDSQGNEYFGTAGYGLSVLSGTTWTTYTYESGLASDYVSALAVDPADNVWVGTDGSGLSVHWAISDTWGSYNADSGDLAGDYVSSVAVDSQGNIWVGTDGSGLSVHWAISDTWGSYNADSGDLAGDYVSSVAVDSQGNVWVGHASSGVSVRWADGSWDTFSSEDDLASGYVSAIAVDSQGNVWVGHPSSGLSVRWAISDTWGTFSTEGDLPDGEIAAIAADASGNVWFGHPDGGLSAYWAADSTWLHYTATDGLAGDDISAVAADPEGNVWTGHDGSGVTFIGEAATRKPRPSTRWTVFTSDDDLADDDVRDVAVGPDNVKWFATGYGVSRLSAGDSTWNNYYPPDLADYDVRAVAVDGENNKWFATGYGVSRLSAGGTWTTYSEDNGLADNNVWAVALDGQGNPWFGTDGGLSVYWTISDTWTTYTGDGDLAADDVSAVAVAPDGDVWVGHPWSGVSRLTGGVWTTYGYEPLVSEYVNEIAVAPTGEIWVGTGDGISVYSPAGDTWTNYPQYNTPWLGGNVMALAFESDGDVWIGFEEAGAVWRAADGSEWKAYSEADGLGDNRVRAISLDRSGSVWFATEGYQAPESYHRSTGLACPVRQSSQGQGGVTRYRPGGRQVLWLETTSVSAGSPAVVGQEWTLAASALGATGKLYLEGELYAASGQGLAAGRQPFYVFDTATALTVNPDRPVYQPGQTATIAGEVRNGSSVTSSNQTLIVQLGAEQASVGPFDVPAGSAYPYAVTLTAPDEEGDVSLSATVEDVFVEDVVTVATPALDVTLDAPDVVGRAAFDLFVELENPSLLDVSIEVAISTSDPQIAIRNSQFAIPSGEIRTLVETYAISTDTVFTISITGGVTQTLVHNITFGEAVETALSPQPVYSEGTVSIPYTLTNTGQLPTVVDLEIGGFEIGGFDTYLPVGAVASGDLSFDLSAGDYTLVYTTPFDGGAETFRVVPAEAAKLSVAAGPRAGSVVTITATVTNTGFYPLTGTLRLETSFFQTDQPISLSPTYPHTHTLTLDTATAAPGTYTATVALLSGSGLPLASSAVSITVPGAALVLTTVPSGTVVAAGQWVTLTFGVANQGSAPATAVLTVTLGDLVNEARNLWLPGGADDTISFSFRAPDGLSGESLAGVFWFEGRRYDLVLDVAGVDLDVSAGWDQSVYDPGATATLHITVANQATTAAPSLYAIVAYHDQTITQALTLAGGATAVLDFALTADTDADGKVFYGIYEADEQRGIHLNTTYLYLLNSDVTIVPDRHVYDPGDTVHAAVYAAATGTLTVTAPGYTTTLVLTGDDTEFQFTLPTTLLRGTYSIDYVLDDGLTRSAPFDVDAVWVRATEARLLDLPYEPGDTVQADLTIASTAPVEVAVLAWLRYPDGTRSAETVDTVSLQDVLNNHVSLTLPLSTTQAGLHRLVYQLADPAEHDRVYAAGTEAFDVGPATLQGLRTDRETYPDPTMPVVAEVTVYAGRVTTAELALAIDGETGWVYPLTLVTGTQNLTFSLPVVIDPGSYSLEATLTAAGLDSVAQTGFLYGTAAADLAVSAPRIVGPTGGPSTGSGQALTRTVEILVHNRGGFPAASTTLQLWDGEPGTGTLLGEETVPGLEAGEMVEVYFDWDILGQGGPHTLHAIVDPAGQVAEFYEENNATSTEVTLPSFALQVETDRETYTAGDEVSITVHATNLMAAGSESLAITTTAEYAGWLQTFQDMSTLELLPLEQDTLQLTWDTTGLLGGDYVIWAQGADQDDEQVQALAALQVYDLANFTASPLTGTAPLTVTFSDLSAPSGMVDSWRWNLGDGSPLVTETNPVHVYETPGQYTVTLTTTVGISTYVEVKPGYITVLSGEEYPPQVDAGPDQMVNEGDVVAFNGTLDDPDTPSGHAITWDLGDGGTASGTLTPTHTYADDGIYLVTVTVTDTSGLDNSDVLTVTVDNVSPDVNAGPDQTVSENDEVIFGGSFTDPGVLDAHTVEWNFGDGGTTGSALTATHTYTVPGVYTVTLTVTDDDGGVGSDTLFVTVGSAVVGSIGDTVWNDLDGNGVQNASEPGIEGVYVMLFEDDGDGVFEPEADDGLVSYTSTLSNGGYIFSNLDAGDYWVDVYDESISAGYEHTSHNDPVLATIAGQDLDTVDFGYRWLSGSTCVTIQRSDSTHDQVLDAYIWAADPDYNGGNSQTLYTGLVDGGEKRSLLWFDLSEIPSDAVVDLSTFGIYLYTSNVQVARVHRITTSWNETVVTWNSFGDSFAGGSEGYLVSQGTGYHYVDLTELTQAWLDGTYDNYGVLLEQNLSGYDTYKSSEYSTNSVRPRLRVCYHTLSNTLPVAGFTAVPSSGSVPLTVTFTDQSSSDAITRTWDLNGITQTLTSAAPISYTYTTPGDYVVTLTVENASGLSDTASLTITASVSSSTNILGNGGFETSDLSSWGVSWGTMNVLTSAKYSGVYGLKMSDTGSIYQQFDTVAGQTYYVSAWIRIDQEITTPSWGGLRVQVVDIPSWTGLGQSDCLEAANSPVGTWTYVDFSFVAIGPNSRIIFSNFSGGSGQFDASADDFIVSLSPVNQRPIAVDDTVTAETDVAISIDVLDNDSDPDDDPLSIQSILDAPLHGTTAIVGEEILYTPDTGFSGTDTFTYTITDGEATNWAVVVVTVINPQDILNNSGFETGDLSSWGVSWGTMNVLTSAKYSGVYGVKMSDTGSIYQQFDTVAGQTYYVSAWIKIDQEITTPSWGGLRVQVVDIPSWTGLGQSDCLKAANSPVGTWTYVDFSFVAIGTDSRIIFSNFSGGSGQFNASADDFIVSSTPIPSP